MMRTVATAMTLALASGCGRVAFEPVRVETAGDSGIINGDATSLCTQRHIYVATASTFFEARTTVERQTGTAASASGPSSARQAFDDLFK